MKCKGFLTIDDEPEDEDEDSMKNLLNETKNNLNNDNVHGILISDNN